MRSQVSLALALFPQFLGILLVSTNRRAFGFTVRCQLAASFRRRSSSIRVAPNEFFQTEQEHMDHQAQTFDFMAGLFSKPDALPPQANAIYKDFAQRFVQEITAHRSSSNNKQEEIIRILDLGCGGGVFFRFLLEEVNRRGVATVELDAVDLSSVMVQNAKKHATQMLQDMNSDNELQLKQHSIRVYQDDACQFLKERPRTYDGVIANSCFANFWDPVDCLRKMMTGLKEGGILVVAHPVGSDFVAGLHQDNPSVTPHLMPTQGEFQTMIGGFPLQLLEFQEDLPFQQRTIPMYYASAMKRPRVGMKEEANSIQRLGLDSDC